MNSNNSTAPTSPVVPAVTTPAVGTPAPGTPVTVAPAVPAVPAAPAAPAAPIFPTPALPAAPRADPHYLNPCPESINYNALAMPTARWTDITKELRCKDKITPPLYNYYISLSGNHEGVFAPKTNSAQDWMVSPLSNNHVEVADVVPTTHVAVIRWLEILMSDLQFAIHNAANEDLSDWVAITTVLQEWQLLYIAMLVKTVDPSGDPKLLKTAISRASVSLTGQGREKLENSSTKRNAPVAFGTIMSGLISFTEKLREHHRDRAQAALNGFTPPDESTWPLKTKTLLYERLTEITYLRLWKRLRYLERVAFKRNGMASEDNVIHHQQLVLVISKLLEPAGKRTAACFTGPWSLASKPGVGMPAPEIPLADDDDDDEYEILVGIKKAKREPVKPLVMDAQFLPPGVLSISDTDFPQHSVDIRISLPVKGNQFSADHATQLQKDLHEMISSSGLTHETAIPIRFFFSSFEGARTQQLRNARDMYIDAAKEAWAKEMKIRMNAALALNPLMGHAQRTQLKSDYEAMVDSAIRKEREVLVQKQMQFIRDVESAGTPSNLIPDRILIMISIAAIPTDDWWNCFSHLMHNILGHSIALLTCCTFDIGLGRDAGLSGIDKHTLAVLGRRPKLSTLDDPVEMGLARMKQKNREYEIQLEQQRLRQEQEMLATGNRILGPTGGLNPSYLQSHLGSTGVMPTGFSGMQAPLVPQVFNSLSNFYPIGAVTFQPVVPPFAQLRARLKEYGGKQGNQNQQGQGKNKNKNKNNNNNNNNNKNNKNKNNNRNKNRN